MNLVIDIGNTRTKIGFFEGGLLRNALTLNNAQTADIPEILKDRQVGKAVISSTIDIPRDLLEGLNRLPVVLVLDHHHKLPFQNLYHSPNTLGRDRIALVAAAHAQYPGQNNLVIGCGTCITFNFINSANEFLGGSIHPGLKMRLQAMHTFTGKLPLVNLEDQAELIGRDTKANMLSGVLFAAAKEIDGMIGEYLVKFPQMNIIITGGDAELLVSRLKNQIFAVPNCTLIGLNHILEYNA